VFDTLIDLIILSVDNEQAASTGIQRAADSLLSNLDRAPDVWRAMHGGKQ
jgi:hypothetical protein